eukprot:7971768-Lingulodinium_polyedra.AAC.1
MGGAGWGHGHCWGLRENELMLAAPDGVKLRGARGQIRNVRSTPGARVETHVSVVAAGEAALCSG